MRKLMLGLVLVLTAATLSACSPASYAWLAVTMINGEPTVLLNTCDRGAAKIYLYEQEPATPPPTPPTPPPSPTDLRGVEVTSPYWAVESSDPDPVNVIPMFSIPSGWHALHEALSTLEPGARYSLNADVENIYRIKPIRFTAEMLASLSPDEVVYGPNAPETTTITRAEFDQKYESECADLRERD